MKMKILYFFNKEARKRSVRQQPLVSQEAEKAIVGIKVFTILKAFIFAVNATMLPTIIIFHASVPVHFAFSHKYHSKVPPHHPYEGHQMLVPLQQSGICRGSVDNYVVAPSTKLAISVCLKV